MNLIIPVIKGQHGMVTLFDNKDKSSRTYAFNHQKVCVFEGKYPNPIVKVYESGDVERVASLQIKGIGRNKRLSRKNITVGRDCGL